MLTRIRHAYHVLGIVDKSDLTNHVFDQPPSRNKKTIDSHFGLLGPGWQPLAPLEFEPHKWTQVSLIYLPSLFSFPLCLLTPTTLRVGVQG